MIGVCVIAGLVGGWLLHLVTARTGAHILRRMEGIALSTVRDQLLDRRQKLETAVATIGETDDFSVRAAGSEIQMRDVHATLLHLMGLDQNRLSVLHAGRYKKLTDIGGRVITEILS